MGLIRSISTNRSVRLAYKAVRHPERAVLRLIQLSRVQRRDAQRDRTRLYAVLHERFGVNGPQLSAEYLTSAFGRWRRQRMHELERFPSLRLGASSDFTCEALYLVVRAARPRVVVETGVLYGLASSAILEALHRNGDGRLYSIDLGCAPDEPPNDFLVHPQLKTRWDLIIGDARQELEPLLDRLPPVDLFHHDSLHTWEHMTWEFQTALPHVADGGLISSDDVLLVHGLGSLFRHNAFSTFCGVSNLAWDTYLNYGLALKPGEYDVDDEPYSAGANGLAALVFITNELSNSSMLMFS